MSLDQRIAELVRACFTGLWVQSFEHDDALARDRAALSREPMVSGHLGSSTGA